MDYRLLDKKLKEDITTAHAELGKARVARLREGGFGSDGMMVSERERRNLQAFRDELKAAEAAAEQKRIELSRKPLNDAEAAYKAAALEVAKAERDCILTKIDIANQDKILDRITQNQRETFTPKDWENAFVWGWNEFIEELGWTNNAAPNVEEATEIGQYLEVNQLYPCEQNLLLAFSRLIQVGAIRATLAPVPEPEPEPEPEEVIPAVGTREYEAFEKRRYQRELLTETLLNPVFDATVQRIVDSTGKKIAGPHLLQFRTWLDSPAQKRRFSPLTRGEIRFAFAEFFGTEEVLTPSECQELSRRRTVDGLSSEAVKQIVGFRNDYAPREHAGIRQP